jgi:daunorubicin resistance ABC transporter ATP-binding subunit
MTAAIHVEGLRKSFARTMALRGVDLVIPAGTVLGLLGPNGAGKTTMVRILATLERPDAGTAKVFGRDTVTEASKVRRLIGLTGQYAAIDGDISGRENLYVIARLFNMPPRIARAAADDMLERFRLTEHAGKPARHYSGGLRRRLDLAASLLGTPRVLYLDEPTTGLDPHSRTALWDVIKAMVGDGMTVLLTTQYMEEAETLADTVVVMDRGEVIAQGSAAELRVRAGGQVLRVRPAYSSDLPAAKAAFAHAGLDPVTGDGDDGAVTVSAPLSGPDQLTAAMAALCAAQVSVAGIDTYVPSLDEVFRALTRAEPERVDLPGEVA